MIRMEFQKVSPKERENIAEDLVEGKFTETRFDEIDGKQVRITDKGETALNMLLGLVDPMAHVTQEPLHAILALARGDFKTALKYADPKPSDEEFRELCEYDPETAEAIDLMNRKKNQLSVEHNIGQAFFIFFCPSPFVE